MSTAENLVLKIFTLLVEEWQAENTVEDIACDEAKLDLMIEVLEAIAPSDEPIPGVLDDLYKKVFLRDEWIAKRKDRKPPD